MEVSSEVLSNPFSAHWELLMQGNPSGRAGFQAEIRSRLAIYSSGFGAKISRYHVIYQIPRTKNFSFSFPFLFSMEDLCKLFESG